MTFFLSQCLAISLQSCKLTADRLRNKAERLCLIKSDRPPSPAAFPHSTVFPSPSLRTMAEALGIAAAAVQFIEISAKLLIAASNLRSKLENAPAKVKYTERSVKQLVSLVERLDADLRPTSSASLADVLSDSSKLEAQNLLEDCITETSALTDLLERLMGKPDDTFVKGKMRAFVSVKKEDEIAERCTRLQDLKSHLSIWYHHQSCLLMRQQMYAPNTSHFMSLLLISCISRLAISFTNVTVEDLRHEINTRFSTLQDSLQPQEATQTASLVYLVLTPHPSSFSLSFSCAVS